VRILYVDIDSLRPDHLGCYGYHRDTSPTIDRLADEGVRFDNCYASDVPCGPSRTALFSGRFGTHTGVVGHNGTTGEFRGRGDEAPFNSVGDGQFPSWPGTLRHSADYRTATITPFPTNHDNWHFLDGFEEWRDTNIMPESGQRPADEVADIAEEWLDDHGCEENWFLHVNFWDPHRPYDTPESFDDPFADDPPPEWPTQSVLNSQNESDCQVGARRMELQDVAFGPRAPDALRTRKQYREWIDGYDTGIRFADHQLGRLLESLEQQGVADDTLVIVSADHGENHGELNVYGTHVTADEVTCHVPLIVSGPGVEPGLDEELHYQLDLAPTITELADGDVPTGWDGRSFVEALTGGDATGRDYVVCTTGWLTTSRCVRWDDWFLIELYDTGVLDDDIDPLLLFDVATDPHQTENLAAERPAVVDAGKARLHDWERTVGGQAARGEAGGIGSTGDGIVDPVLAHLRESGGDAAASATAHHEP
jgi:choline-sulfatase